MSLGGEEGIVGERGRDGVGVHVNYLGLMFFCSLLNVLKLLIH